jgi:hypothetical protein
MGGDIKIGLRPEIPLPPYWVQGAPKPALYVLHTNKYYVFHTYIYNI